VPIDSLTSGDSTPKQGISSQHKKEEGAVGGQVRRGGKPKKTEKKLPMKQKRSKQPRKNAGWREKPCTRDTTRQEVIEESSREGIINQTENPHKYKEGHLILETPQRGKSKIFEGRRLRGDP